MLLGIFQRHAWLHHSSEIWVFSVSGKSLLDVKRLKLPLPSPTCDVSNSRERYKKFCTSLLGRKKVQSASCQRCPKRGYKLSTRIPHQASSSTGRREIPRGRVLDHVCGLRVRQQVLSRHQPPHAGPARVAGLDDLVAEDVLHGCGVHAIRGDDEVGLQDLATLGSYLSIFGVLVRAHQHKSLLGRLGHSRSQQPWTAPRHRRGAQGLPSAWQAASAGCGGRRGGRRTWAGPMSTRSPCSSWAPGPPC